MDRPTILIEPGRKPWAVDGAEDAILENYSYWGFYQRGDILVRATIATADDVERERKIIRRAPGAVVLRRATQAMIEDVFGRAIRWQKWVTDKKIADIDCPPKIAILYLSRDGLWRLPHLVGIIEAPIMRPDGTVLTSPGYDPETGLLLQSPIEWQSLPLPSLDAAQTAVKSLKAPFGQFPFSHSSGISVLISAIVTGLQRRLLASAPAHAFDAAAQGSGKSLLADCVSLIVTGRNLASMSANKDEEELRKKLMSVLIGGDPLIGFDNITRPLKSDALATVLTQDTYKDRILGVTGDRAVPTNSLFILTGNNLSFSGDMPSRVIVARIEADVERPEERDNFKILDLRKYILENRTTLVAAGLTILRSYHSAGRPAQAIKQFGRYEQWSSEIRAALVWAGLPDPCLTREDVIESDPERDSTLAVLENWHKVAGDAITLRALIDLAVEAKDLRTALLDIASDNKNRDQISSGRLAAWCRSHTGRVVGDFKLSRERVAHGGFKTWQVVKIEKQNVGESK
ncbi:MAG: hypothetical protein ACYDC3_18365 [Candidatus Binataceae bacterium]